MLQIQSQERLVRNKEAEEAQRLTLKEIEDHLSNFYHIPTMRRRASIFISKFSNEDWVLDIGVGWGWHWLNLKSPNIVGIDFSYQSLKVANILLKSHPSSSLHLICADARYLPIKDGIISGMWSVQAFQHMPTDILSSAFRECRRVLKKGAISEIYWYNNNRLIRLIRKIFGKQYIVDGYTGSMYVRRVNAKQLHTLVSEHFNKGKDERIRLSYCELFFHPDLKLTHKRNLNWLESVLSKIPLLSALLARQIVASFSL